MYIEPETYGSYLEQYEEWLRESLAEGYDAEEGYEWEEDDDLYHEWIEENQ